jgi:hypothetical protein
MRTLLVAVAAALALPSAASAASLFEQYQATSALLLGTAGDPGGYLANYPVKLIENLNGKWTNIGPLQLTQDNQDLIAKACQAQPIAVAAADPSMIKMVHNQGTDHEVTTTFTSMGGNFYGQATEPGPLLHWMGLDGDGPVAEMKVPVVQQNNGVATILRPSVDILVIQTNYGTPTILGRCPQ